MFNLLRMDLKRLQKSKSSYVILILSMVVTFIFFMAFYIALNPDLQAWMNAHGFVFQMNGVSAEQSRLSLLEVFHITYTQNFLALFVGIVVILFNCHENECGFIKNIFSIHVNRLHYIFSKTIALSLYAFFIIMVCFIEVVLLNLCVSSFFVFNLLNEIVLYLVLLWLIVIALVCMYIALSIWLKSKSGCIGTVIIYATGIWMSIVQPLLSILGWQKVLDYTLMNKIGTLSYYVQNIDVNSILGIIVNIMFFIIVYTSVSALRLRKKDI